VVYAGIIFIGICAIAMYATRVRLAEMQAALWGGRMGPGCVVAEAVAMVVLAVVLWLVSMRLGLR